jgi:anti-sigma B factor antagonist
MVCVVPAAACNSQSDKTMSAFKTFRVETNDGVAVVRFSQHTLLGHGLIGDLRSEFFAFIDAESPQKMLIDFTDVEFCSTEVISLLLNIKRRLAKHNGRLKLSSMKDNVREVFRMLNIEKTVFDIHDSTNEALASFSAPESDSN